MREAASKIVARNVLREKLAERKSRGRHIVLANGCFDTLHVGIFVISKVPRREGDILGSAWNADSSVRNLKGPGRPILNEDARAQLVCRTSLRGLRRALRPNLMWKPAGRIAPDVHAKGTDYTADTCRSAPSPATWHPLAHVGRQGSLLAGAVRVHSQGAACLTSASWSCGLGSLGEYRPHLSRRCCLRESFPEAEIVWLTHPAGKRWSRQRIGNGYRETETRSYHSCAKSSDESARRFTTAIDIKDCGSLRRCRSLARLRRIGFSSQTIRRIRPSAPLHRSPPLQPRPTSRSEWRAVSAPQGLATAWRPVILSVPSIQEVLSCNSARPCKKIERSSY